MDFTYSSEQESLRDSVKRFVEREYGWEERCRIIRSERGIAAGHWATFAELGWLGAGLAEEAGGFGGGAIENALIAEELGRGLVTEPFLGHVVATQLLVPLPLDPARALVEGMVMGETRVVLALQEPAGRGDWRLIETSAGGPGEVVRLKGRKSLVEGGPFADTLIVSARVGERTGLYLVDAGGVGVQRHSYRTLDNRRVSDFTFDDAAATLLLAGADADAVIERAVEHGIVALCGEALGIMDAALWATRDYLKVRRQFGTAIGNFQAVQHRMADMLIEVEMTRSILFHALGTMAGDDADARAAAVSAAKAQVSSGGLFVGGQAIQLHGGIGVTEELIISHFYRRLFVIAKQLGDESLHIARFAEAIDRRRDV